SVDARYAVYLSRQEDDITAFRKEESIAIPGDFRFGAIAGLSTELRTKLERDRPASLGQAARLDGMTPAALMLILAHVKKGARAKSA
ncbi:MAG TPA: tRNA uridine-5-carboxymethylaminomethyl(34) synthesis enzyme MnmG, partial [Methyloceanibacter sp.]|nr:tRNA uridine-5-carboxymethylaminomethyl(34) synthesis enzyme MnmG [Methyloceanibacter sp.]